mmetsp:Transcript_23775/g.52680  ORF Transcript_23775/g.52680 Transcript_23775/m.52680 type:complete len:83 (+) Transcript_23775:565-813(+)
MLQEDRLFRAHKFVPHLLRDLGVIAAKQIDARTITNIEGTCDIIVSKCIKPRDEVQLTNQAEEKLLTFVLVTLVPFVFVAET